MTITRELVCDLTAPAQARAWTRQALTAGLPAFWDGLVDDAVLCVSELVTNAMQAGCALMTLGLDPGDQLLRLFVIDDGPGEPAPRTPGPLDPSGRGLMIVARLAHRWGVDPAASGKEVWAEFRRPVSA